MRTLLILLRTNFLSLVGSFRKKGTVSVIAAAIGLVVLALFMIGMFAIIGGSTTFILVEKDLDEFAIYLSISLSLIIALMFGVTNSTRDARGNDTDMLLAMPIPKSCIVLSKLLGMYLLDVLCSLVMLVPTFLIVCFVGDHSFALFGRGMVIAFLLPALPLFISLLFSALISYLKKATKFGQIASTIVSMGAVLLYMIVVPNISSYAESMNISPAESVDKMKKILPFYWFTEAIYSGDLLCMILTILVTLIPMVLAVYIHTRGLNGVNYQADNSKKARSFKTASVRKAALQMELRRYFSSSNYVMNTLFGTVILLVAVIVICVKGINHFPMLEDITVNGEPVNLLEKFAGPAWAAITSLLILFFAAMTYTTPPSVSVEGKRIWISKTLPIPTKDILNAKILVSVLIFQPVSIACCIALSIATKCGILPCILSILISSGFQLLTSLIGLIFGLIYVRLDWTNEAQVIKNGFAIILTMIISFLLIGPFAAGSITALIIGDEAVTYGILGGEVLLLVGLCAGAYAIITHYGVRKYESLNG
ncbi:MAG: hypothetical protein J5379_06890 [Clostridiales bacterium]|nr:hypothetical protein [Clostridiales bacterium]